MPGGFVLCEYDDVKTEFPEFEAIMNTLEAKLQAKAMADWAPATYGGLKPTAGQFGKSTIMPPLFVGNGATTLVTWKQWLPSTGSQTLLLGSNTGRLYEDYKVGFAGLAFLDKAIKVSEIKLQIGDKKLPRINIEEMRAYEKPAIIFEDNFIVDEETGFEMLGYVEVPGEQTIELIGLELNRIPDKLFVTHTGDPLL